MLVIKFQEKGSKAGYILIVAMQSKTTVANNNEYGWYVGLDHIITGKPESKIKRFY